MCREAELGSQNPLILNGDPGGSRTPNPQIRSLMLYPIELRGRPPATAKWRTGESDSTPLAVSKSLLIVLSFRKNSPCVVTSKRMAFVPNPVTHSSSRLLEFEILRDLLAGYASSPLGKRRIAELVPSLDHA